MIRVVLDTNILVSATLTSGGNESRVVELARAGQIIVCVTSSIVAEYWEVLSRPKFKFPLDELRPLLHFLNADVETVEPVQAGLASPDPSDTMFIACAVAAGADFLVTGNRRHFPEPAYGSAKVVTARELLVHLT